MSRFIVRWGYPYSITQAGALDFEPNIYAHVDGWFFNWHWHITAGPYRRAATLASGKAWTQAGATADAITAAHDPAILETLRTTRSAL